MSESVIKENGIHVLLGICGLDEALQKQLKEEFSKRGREIDICVSKYQKLGIEQYVSEHKDVDVLIVSEYLQKSKPYKVEDFEKLNDISNHMVIIPILENEKKGTSYISELLGLGIFTALFSDDANLSALAEMAFTGRSRKEAKFYYGSETVNDIGDSADIQTCIDYIAFRGEEEKTKERADYVQSRLTQKDFETVIAKLPKDIRDRLRVYDDYTQFFEGTDIMAIEKKSFFQNRLIKTKTTETAIEAIVPTVVKQEVQSAVKKVVIGFAGTQPRVGTTHQTILFGNYLNAAGYKIAVVETDLCESKSFGSLENKYNVKKNSDCFTYQDIDYYSCFNLNELNRIFLKDYNFVLIDFGTYNEGIAMEFGRCVVQVIVSGAKPWEIPMLERLMILVNDEDVLKKFNYLFMFAPDNEKKDIIKNMDVLNKVFFADLQADPFIRDGYNAIKEMLEDYLPNGNIIRKGRLFDVLKRLFE